MVTKDRLVKLLEPFEVWRDLFPSWEPGRNVSCVAAENHKDGNDERPSMALSEDGKAYCHACGWWATSPIGVFEKATELEFADAMVEMYSRYIAPLVPEDYVRKSAERLEKSPFVMAAVTGRRMLTTETVKRYNLGWDEGRGRLVIPITDENGMCVNVRMHDTLRRQGPDGAKILSWKKGFGTPRLWPLDQLGAPRVFLVEGELDALAGISLGVPAVTVTGGANTWKDQWATRFKGKDVVVIPDVDLPGKTGKRAGEEGAKARAASIRKKAKSVTVLWLPGLDGSKDKKDLTDWIRMGGTRARLVELAEKARPALVAEEVDESEAGEKEDTGGESPFDNLSPQERTNIERGDAAFEYMNQGGAFFVNPSDELFYAMEGGGTIRMGDKSEALLSFLSSRVSWVINTASASGKFVVRHVLGKARASSRRSITGSWCLFEEAEGAIYVLAGGDKVVKAKGGALETVKNALNDRGVLLETPPLIRPFEPDMGAEPAKAAAMFWERVIEPMPVPHADKLLVASWVLGTFLKEYVRPKPLLRLMAKTAYGKSTACKAISIFLYGDEVIQSPATTPAAMYSIARQYPLMVFDNIETRNMTPGFEDFLLTAATGGGKSKRQLNTDRDVVWENTNCQVMSNGIEPASNKRELVSRTVEVHLDIPRYGAEDFHETRVFDAIRQGRAYMLSGLLRLLGGTAVPRVKGGEVQRIARELGHHSKNRFDEFLGVMATVLDALWPHVPHEGFKSPNAVVDEWLRTQTLTTEEQDEGTNEVLYFLSELVDRRGMLLDTRVPVQQDKNGAVRVTAATRELFTDFRVLAKGLGVRCPWQNERHLGTRIADSFGVLRKAGWSHGVKILSGRRINEFTKKAPADPVRAVAAGAVRGVQELDVHAGAGAAGEHAVRGVRDND